MHLASLPFEELLERVKARENHPDKSEDIDIDGTMRYLVALPISAHTADSVDVLVRLGRIFYLSAQPAEALHAASHAARVAVAVEDKLLLCRARRMEGLALIDLGRFAEATVAQVESWSLARGLGDRKREILAISGFGGICVGMGQWNVAIRYFERARELAEENGFTNDEFVERTNLAHCAVQLREPTSGLRALSQFSADAPGNTQAVLTCAFAYHTLARLQVLIGDIAGARVHAEEAARLALTVRCEKKFLPPTEAVLGLIDVSSGAVERGLSRLHDALTSAKRLSHTGIPDYLGMLIDAYEAAGYPDKALEYLKELVEWKKKLIDAAATPLQYEGLAEPIQFQTGASLTDEGLLAKAYSLEAGVQDRLQHFVETAINAEIASGHDLYRTFRVAKLAWYLAVVVGWNEERSGPLSLGAQLCNIGMIAIPTRVLLKPGALSDVERHVLRDHTRYGAELLRKSKLRILDIASVICEQHHERYDGRGYPRGLAGEAIAKEARVVAICDAFDAMTHPRPWRAIPLSIPAALNELQLGAGTQFDPLFMTAFIELMHSESCKHDDLDAFLAEGADEVEYVRTRARMEMLLREKTPTDRAAVAAHRQSSIATKS